METLRMHTQTEELLREVEGLKKKVEEADRRDRDIIKQNEILKGNPPGAKLRRRNERGQRPNRAEERRPARRLRRNAAAQAQLRGQNEGHAEYSSADRSPA